MAEVVYCVALSLDGYVATPYVQNIAGSCVTLASAKEHFSFSVACGSLPPGLARYWSLTLCALRDTPTQAGTYDFVPSHR